MENSPPNDLLLSEKIRSGLLRCMFDAVCDDYERRISWFDFKQRKILKNIRSHSFRLFYVENVDLRISLRKKIKAEKDRNTIIFSVIRDGSRESYCAFILNRRNEFKVKKVTLFRKTKTDINSLQNPISYNPELIEKIARECQWSLRKKKVKNRIINPEDFSAFNEHYVHYDNLPDWIKLNCSAESIRKPPVEIFELAATPIELRLHKLLNSARAEYAQLNNSLSCKSLSQKLYQDLEILFDLPKTEYKSRDALISAIQIKNNYRFGSYSAWIKHKFASFFGMKPHYGTLESLFDTIHTLEGRNSRNKHQHFEIAQLHLKALLKRYPEKDAGIFDSLLLHLECKKENINHSNQEVASKPEPSNDVRQSIPGLKSKKRIDNTVKEDLNEEVASEEDPSNSTTHLNCNRFFSTDSKSNGSYEQIRRNSI